MANLVDTAVRHYAVETSVYPDSAGADAAGMIAANATCSPERWDPPAITRRSSRLRRGDVVLTHGMRVLLDTDPTEAPGQYGPVYRCDGQVLNAYELDSSTLAYVGRSLRWTIQGNDHAVWAVHPEAGGRYVR